MKSISIFLLLFITFFQLCQGQNLILNPGAEDDPLSSGWTSIATGTSCGTGSNWRIQGGVSTYPAAQEGTFIYYSGCGSINGEIYQDIDVSAHAATIDANRQSFAFSGYTHSFNQSPADGARIIVEYSDISSVLLGSYDTGFTTNTSGWTINSDTRNAPVTTRSIRIRLLSEANNGSSVDGYFDNLSLTTSTVAPIELMYFTAEITQPHQVTLSWETAKEFNNDFFTVERTQNETEWETVEVVEGAGNSDNQLKYTTLDTSPYQEVTHYRLKQTDFNGQFSYSEVATVNLSDVSNNQTYLFPNPARETVTIVASQRELSKVKLFSVQGIEVNDYVTRFDTTRSQVMIDIKNLNPGFYFIKTMTEHFKFYKY